MHTCEMTIPVIILVVVVVVAVCNRYVRRIERASERVPREE